MPIVKSKPTSAGRRFVVRVVSPNLHKGEPYAPLVEKQGKTGGRNNAGRVTTRHKGGGHKRRYRAVDFKRTKDGIKAAVERLEYDPNRSAHIALIRYADGERAYIIAPRGLKAGDTVMSGVEASIAPGNCLPLRSIRWARSCTTSSCRRARRTDRACRRRLGADHRPRGRPRDAAPALGRAAQGPLGLPRGDRRGQQLRPQPALARQGGAKRWRGIRPTCAAWR